VVGFHVSTALNETKPFLYRFDAEALLVKVAGAVTSPLFSA